METVESAPKRAISLTDAIALIVGIVIGSGIFETPALVAANVDSSVSLFVAWIVGGVVSVAGALCYAELATSFPNVGGAYYFLKRSFGSSVAFLFAWARMTVIQTGSIALLAFVFGDYLSQVASFGTYSSPIYAAIAIAVLTGLNILGLREGKWTQNLLTIAKILGLALVIVVGFTSPASPASPAPSAQNVWGLAMLFVLLSYGGWNEAAYISAEIQNPHRNIVRSLLYSIGIITALYVLINGAYLRGLSLAGMAKADAVAASLMDRSLGTTGSIFVSLLIAISALGSLNATIFTGARTNFALGQDFKLFRRLAQWQQDKSTPQIGFLVQGAIALILIAFATLTPRSEFKSIVEYTAPVFWLFFLLVGISLFVLRQRSPDVDHPFRVPLYPIVPLFFCFVCGYLLYASLAYTGIHAIVGLIVMALGVPVLMWNQRSVERSV